MSRAFILCAILAGCGGGPSIEVVLRVPPAQNPLRGADGVVLSIREASGQVLAARRGAASASSLTLPPVPPGAGRVVELDATLGPDVVARGQSCPFDVAAGAGVVRVPVYFSTVASFAPTGSPQLARDGAVAFATDGGVLLAGGATMGGAPIAGSERYDPATGQFQPGPDLATPRSGAEAASLPDGTTLVFGGAAAGAIGIEALSMGKTTPLPAPFPPTLTGEASVVLGDGRVLVAGGELSGGPPRADTFLLASGGAALTPGASLSQARARHTLTLAGDERAASVLVVGGLGAAGPVAEIEIFDPADGSFTLSGAQLGVPRYDHSATRLADGRLLIAGGRGADGKPIASAEIFDPITRSVQPTGSLRSARAQHTATLLASGRVLIAGGIDVTGAPNASAEIFDPTLGPAGDFVPTAQLSVARAGHAAVALCDGTLLLVGGGAGAALYNPAP